MTREEAAKRIKEIQKLYVFTPTINEALDLAIEALVLQDKYVKALERMIEGAKEINKFLEEAAKKSDEKHQLSEETSTNEGDAESATTTEDCISRQVVTDLLLDAQDGSGQTYEVIRELLHGVAYMPSVPVAKNATTEQVTGKLKKSCDSLLKPDSDECKEQKSKLDCINRQQAIEAIECVDWYHVNSKGELVHGSTSDEESWYKAEDIYEAIESLPPVTPTEQNEEDILKFYYVESLDEYWIGQRCGTRYYGKWTGNCFTYGYSRYLPWGEHVVAPDTLWKEHTYPSEPKEIPFNEWLQGFLEKECQTERTGGWVSHELWDMPWFTCSECNYHGRSDFKFCPNCGAKMKGGTEND